MANRYSGIFTQGYGIGPTPQANIVRDYRTPPVPGYPGGVVPPMALRQPASAAPATRPFVLPMLQRIAQAAAQKRQAEERAATAPSAPVAGMGAAAPSTAPTSFSDAFSAGLMSPTGRAITGASLAGLAAGGYSPTPVSLGQTIASMGAAAQKGYFEGKQAEIAEAQRKAAAEKAAFDRRLAIAQYYQKEREIGGVQGEKAFGNEKQLRSEFDKQAKVFDEARLGFEKVQKAAMTETPTGATDIALIFGYMKVIDPTSVVREGEFATAENAGGIGSKLRNTYNKIVKGERLAPEVRQDFVRAARTQFMPYLDMQKNVEDRYSNLSEAYNLDASKVVLSRLPKTGTLARPYTSFKTLADAEAAKLPKGTYIQIGGKLYVED